MCIQLWVLINKYNYSLFYKWLRKKNIIRINGRGYWNSKKCFKISKETSGNLENKIETIYHQ